MTTETAPQKPRLELAQESQETLSVLDLDRTPREEKLRRETSYLDGADEVTYSERAFRPRHAATIDEVREAVDALEARRVLPPEAPVPAAPELPAEPAVRPVAIPDHYRGPLEAAIEGALVSVETIHRVGTGTVVEASWEDATGALRRGLYLVKEGQAVPYESLAARIDELPAPAPAPMPLEAIPAAQPAPQPAPVAAPPAAPPAPASEAPKAEKKGLMGRFGRGEKKAEAPAAPPAPAPEAAKPEEPKKGLGGKLGFLKKEKAAEAPPAAPPAEAPAEPAEKGAKKRFGFGRK